ncbi:hypothetical protein [Nocardioides sp. SYSU DS0651]|uniref:hypothetical protein n=1 Tax=Nocardioides sp. SYSU DS0651 TaxID=3415955 RepID=UPI003F4C6369
MSKYRIRAAALLAAGAVTGGVTAATLSATAQEAATDAGAASQASAFGRGDGDRPAGGPGHGFGHGFGDTADLAAALGVDQDELESALDEVREQLRPDGAGEAASGEDDRRTPPTDAERDARDAAFAKALADELGVAESKVTDALSTVRSAHAAEHREQLAERLDQAVEDGDITAADKASVLKAYDAGVIRP